MGQRAYALVGFPEFENAISCSDAFSSREPETTSLENALTYQASILCMTAHACLTGR